MFKRIMVVLAVVAAGTMGLGVAHATDKVANGPDSPGFMYAYCTAGAKLSQTTNKGAFACTAGPKQGEYYVTFNQPVTNCAFMATLGIPFEAYTPLGPVTASQGSTPYRVNVVTGGPAPSYDGIIRRRRAFFLAVFC